jgi:hypothetical protein
MEDVMAKLAAGLVEGILPQEFAGATRSLDPIGFAEHFSRMREPRDGKPVQGDHDLLVTRRLLSLIANFEQLGPQRSEIGVLAVKT